MNERIKPKAGLDLNLQRTQANVLQSKATEILMGGAAFGGKSHLLKILAMIYALRVPNISVYIIRRTLPELRATYLAGQYSMLNMLKNYIDAGWAKYNKQENRFVFKNGASIYLTYLDDENSLQRLLGIEINLLLIDEASTIPSSYFGFLRSRVRIGSLDIPEDLKGKLPFIVYATNPIGISASWFKKNFVDYGANVVHKAPVDQGGMMREFIPSRVEDNPRGLANDPTYIDKLKGMGSAHLVNAYLYGEWEQSEGRALPKFTPKIHVLKVDPRDLPYTFTKTVGFDYGLSAASVALWSAKTNGEVVELDDGSTINIPPDSMIIFDEDYQCDKDRNGLRLTTEESATRIKNVTKKYSNVRYGPADRSIFDVDRNSLSIAGEFKGEGVDWVRSNKNPGSRISGLQLANNMVSESTKKFKERPCFFVTENCVDLIQDLIDLQLDEKNKEDVETKSQFDHSWDSLRYLILQASMEVKVIKVVGA